MPTLGVDSTVKPPSHISAANFNNGMPKPTLRVVRSKTVHTAFYGFGDASSSGFGASVARKDGTQGRFGLWARDEDKESSNFGELLNLVQTVEGEVECG